MGIPYGRQDINQADIDAVLEVLKSDYLTQGPKVPLFEQTIADYSNVPYVCAVNSATSALHIACLALGLTKGGLLWTSPISFVASANCALYCGAQVDFVDINPVSFNLCEFELEEKLIRARRNNCLPDIVVPVHMAGQSCNMEKIHALSLEYGFKIIEDASHAIGAKYLQQNVGSCKYSDITVFSFHPVKIITTAEGGVATTKSADLARKMELYRSHGVTRDVAQMERLDQGAWYYEQLALGFNYRMTELHAALGISQMQRLDEFVDKRHSLVARYNTELSGLPLSIPTQSAESYSSFHLYILQINFTQINATQKEVFDQLRAAGVGVNLHYIPIHLQPYYRDLGFKAGDFPHSEAYYAAAMSIPLYFGLTAEDQDVVIDRLKSVLK